VSGPDQSSDAGLYRPDAFVVQFDPSGRTNWVKRWGGVPSTPWSSLSTARSSWLAPASAPRAFPGMG